MDQKHGKLPKEVFKFAKSMGIDLEGLEPEAEDMWRMLDEMATNDAIGYHEFVKEQLQSGQPESTEQSSSRSFRPSSGFCVRTKTLDGDGLKIRDITSNEARGKTLFVNVCSSRLIEEATDNGKPLLLGRTTADSLSVPLAIGKPRDFDKESIAIDAVVHPTVVDTANSSGSFRQQIVELILQWVNQESGIKFEKHWEYNDLAYVGGRGDTKNVPVLFMVDDQAQQSMESKQDPLQNTSSLLSEITKNNDSPVVHENIEPSILLNPSPRENKASLIQSLDDPVVNKSNEAKSTKNEVLHVEEESKVTKDYNCLIIKNNVSSNYRLRNPKNLRIEKILKNLPDWKMIEWMRYLVSLTTNWVGSLLMLSSLR